MALRPHSFAFIFFACALAVAAGLSIGCKSSSDSTGGSGGTGAPDGGGSGGTSGSGGTTGGSGGAEGVIDGGVDGGLPTQFTKADSGGYKIGPAFIGAANTASAPAVPAVDSTGSMCSQMLAVVRDFRGVAETDGHPDFEAFAGAGAAADVTTGLVADMLGDDRKPVYASQCEAASNCPFGQETTGSAVFDQWFRSVAGVDQQFYFYLMFDKVAGRDVFRSGDFFPVDGQGWGNHGKDARGADHNFSFTVELHATFKYGGGETITISGDDDTWVFINGSLAADLGGVHGEASKQIDLDAAAAQLSIAKGSSYPVDVFHAERHTPTSTLAIDWNLAFANCGELAQ